MPRSQQTNNGDNSIQNSGDNGINTINNYNILIQEQSKPHLPPTSMAKLLQQYISTINSSDDKFELKPPPGLNEKLEFNHAKQHIELFQIYANDWAQLDSVERDFPDSQLLFNDLNRMFIDKRIASGSYNANMINGDQLLLELRKQIYNRIKNSAGFDRLDIYEEQLQAFCICLLALAVAKCKVLLRPGDQ